jgi:hypothetical protein
MGEIPASCRAKMGRAEHHFQVLRAQIDSALTGKNQTIRPESNADLTEYRFYLKFKRSLDSKGWGLIFGDAVHNLRSALDHGVYAMGVKESGKDPPDDFRHLAFPITFSEDDWKKKCWVIKSLSNDARATIQRLQPYDSLDEYGFSPLGGLEELDNADKHRALRVVAVLPEKATLDAPRSKPLKIECELGPLKEDTPFLTASFALRTPNVKARHPLVLQPGTFAVRRDDEELMVLLWQARALCTAAVEDTLKALSGHC